jgi:hypothetical protein
LVSHLDGTPTLQGVHEIIQCIHGANEEPIVGVLQQTVVKLEIIFQAGLWKEKQRIKRPYPGIQWSGIGG